MNKLHNKNFKVLLITLIILTVMSVLSIADNSVIPSVFNAASKNLFRVSAAATSDIDSMSTEELRAENEKLKKENDSLRKQLADYYDIKAENEKLWKYYDLKKENPSYNIVPSSVIKRDTNDDFYSFTLDVGTAQGVKVNDAVITDAGLAGWVSSADLTTCRVTTILSPNTKVSAVDKKTGDMGIISGSTALCDENLTGFVKLEKSNNIKTGDMLTTSGIGGVYPENLIIGKVKEIKFDSFEAAKYAVVEPYEDIRKITSAAVITDFGTKGNIEVGE